MLLNWLGLLVAALCLHQASAWNKPSPACPVAVRQQIAFGVATAAYQVEGAVNVDGRSPSIWDVFVHANRSRILGSSTADVACDMYHKYPQDVALMKSMGIKNYRFSVSWSRIVPSGRKGGPVNPKGVAYYNSLINKLLAAGITPAVTLFHWDLPQANQAAYEGLIAMPIIQDFLYFADVCFAAFGDRVKKWVTFNEPLTSCNEQYGKANFAPGINKGGWGKWHCGHNVLLAHGRAVQLYRAKYKARQGGKIGMALWTEWAEPYTNTPEDKLAAQNKMDIDVGWFADTIAFGDYPPLLRQIPAIAQFLPVFTPEEKAMLKGSYDFFGVTFYTGKLCRAVPDNPNGFWITTTGQDGKEIGPQAESYWLYYVPWSFSRILDYLHKRYNGPEIWVLENGVSEKGEGARRGPAVVVDSFRTQYFAGYIDAMCKSIAQGVKVTHYYIWSFLDNWEWREGYTTKFGIVHVNFASPALTRTVKHSGHWLSENMFRLSNRRA